MKIAIVGSRNYRDLLSVYKFVEMLPTNTMIISGGARGVDETAIKAAKATGKECRVYVPDWDAYGKSAGAVRNKLIVDAADQVVAFWDGKSKGTKITIDLAQKAGKKITIYDSLPFGKF